MRERIENTVICHYRPREGSVEDLLELIGEHRKVLTELEMVTDRPEELYIGHDQDGSGPLLVKIFQWVDDEAPGRAHSHPRVGTIWEQMGALCESRAAGPAMDFPHFHSRVVA